MTFEELLKESHRTVPHLNAAGRAAWAKQCAETHPGFTEQAKTAFHVEQKAKEIILPHMEEYRFSPEVDYWAQWIWRILVLLVLLALCAANLRAQTGYSPTDACQRGPKHFTVISTTASVQLVAGAAGTNIYVCGLWIAPIATATNIAFVEGTGSVCGTGTAALPTMGGGGNGGAGTGPNLAVNEGYVVGTGGWSIGMTATVADNVCIILSAANQISGTIIWVQRP